MKRLLLPIFVVAPLALCVTAPAKPLPKTAPRKVAPVKAKAPIPASLDYLWEQSDRAFHAGDYPTAVKIHRAIVTLDPTDTESFGVGAWLLWSLGQKADARAFIQQGLTANPNNAEMWDTAGQHYDLEKSYADAKAAYVKSVALAGKQANELLRHRLAHSAEHAGDLPLSVQTWTELVHDYPTSAVNKNNLARVKALAGKAEKTVVSRLP